MERKIGSKLFWFPHFQQKKFPAEKDRKDLNRDLHFTFSCRPLSSKWSSSSSSSTSSSSLSSSLSTWVKKLGNTWMWGVGSIPVRQLVSLIDSSCIFIILKNAKLNYYSPLTGIVYSVY